MRCPNGSDRLFGDGKPGNLGSKYAKIFRNKGKRNGPYSRNGLKANKKEGYSPSPLLSLPRR